MKLLGAVIAGGRSRRFGSDKAEVMIGGKRLIELSISGLLSQCGTLVVCGREEPGFTCLIDRPEPDLGPLGGLNAALHHAAEGGFDAVLSSGCDIPNLPANLAEQLAGSGAAVAADQPVVGLWPARLAADLDAFLSDGGRSLYGFAEQVGATLVNVAPALRNINRPEDIAR